jgi:apolipoprotein N-acyltransferase
LVPVASAGLLSLSFPPFNLSLLVFAAVAPWLAWLRRLSARQAAASGYLFGSVYFLYQMFWVAPFVAKWTGSAALGAVPWVLSSAVAGLFFVPLGWGLRACQGLRWYWAVPLVWAAVEGFRAQVPVLAFPWANLAHPLWIVPSLVQHAAFGTVFLVSAWVALANLVFSLQLWPVEPRDREPRFTMRLLVAFCLFLVLSAFRAGRPPAGKPLQAVLGQPGVDMAFTPSDEERRLLDSAALLLASQARSAGLLVLPEGFADASARVPPKTVLGDAPPVPVLFGGKRVDGERVYQTAFGYADGWEHADKHRLVVFGEFVPFRGLPVLGSFRLPGGDLTAAPQVSQLQLGEWKVGPLLCFEGVFPDIAAAHTGAGVQLLVQMSIDDWYEGTPAWDQLWQSSVWRSIESGVPLLRVGGRGRSLATDSRGRLVALVPKGIMAAQRVTVTVPESSDAAPYRFAFVYACWLAFAGVGVVAALRRI